LDVLELIVAAAERLAVNAPPPSGRLQKQGAGEKASAAASLISLASGHENAALCWQCST